MRVLLIKTSSMGDIIHTLPALTDAHQAIPHIKIDWVVEDVFAQIPRWHPLIENIIPVALRRWRKGIFSRQTWDEWKQLRVKLQEHDYDLVLDAQCLFKSAFLTLFTKGIRVGLDWHSARESLASLAYQRKCVVNFYQHAIVRMRSFFSQALEYTLPTTFPDFGIHRNQFKSTQKQGNYLVFLHGTTWTSKQWPEAYWVELAYLAEQAGYTIKISGGSADEVQRAERIAEHNKAVQVIPYLDISSMANLLANAKAAIAVDTGFGHLAAALNVPTVSLYGATNAEYTGAIGTLSTHLSAKFLCSPCLNRTCTFKKPSVVKPACFETITPRIVWKSVQEMMN